ncbi:TCR/Tet family MFS transporter [Cohaesibacter haloalkalitolerans]|uniref:TCR/Tet family MFS transporter n=1 Tax=Cohaesibacter haloalkalitolerans TaxID=1162980 RepID=UPI000E64B63D|nr:TCR/Tet family MFS transporter [Cohaesibacter haloalkalitolerans]
MQEAKLSPSSRRHSAFFALITVFLDAMGIGLIMPVMPDLLQHLTHATLSDAAVYGGYLSFVYAAMQFFMGPTLGNLSDRFGRRPVMLVSLAFMGINYLIMGFAGSLVLLFIARLLSGITGATHTCALAFVADISKPEEKTRNFGLVSAGFGLGFIAGPVIGGLTAEISVVAPFFFAAGLTVLNLLYGYFIFPETLEPENRRPFEWRRANPIGTLIQATKTPGIVLFFAAFFFFHLATQIYPTVFPFFTREVFGWSSLQTGISLGIYGFFYALVQVFLIRLMLNWFEEKTVAFIGISIEALGMLAFLFITKGWVLMAGLPVIAIGAVGMAALQGLVSNRVPANAQGELQGGISSIMSLTAILSPLIMTHTFSFFSEQGTSHYFPAGTFGVAGLIALITLWPLQRAIASTSPRSNAKTDH